MKLMNIKLIEDKLWNILYPRICPVCGEILADRELQRFQKDGGEEVILNPYICKYCYKRIVFVDEPKCMKCGRPLENETREFCENCETRISHFDRGISLMLHDDNSRKIIYGLKYGGIKDNADFLGRETALRLGKTILSWQAEALIPVPVHKKRELQRGFNQALLIADSIEKNLIQIHGISPKVDSEILIRTGKTNPQKELDAEARANNLKHAFQVNGNDQYKRVLLVDDIYTTGATLNECARTLKDAGVETVCFVTMSVV